MGITNKIKFINTEKTTREITSNTSWEEQGTLVNSSSLVAGNDYLLVAWVNCTSVGTNEGATKLNFEGGSDGIINTMLPNPKIPLGSPNTSYV